MTKNTEKNGALGVIFIIIGIGMLLCTFILSTLLEKWGVNNMRDHMIMIWVLSIAVITFGIYDVKTTRMPTMQEVLARWKGNRD